MKKGMEKHKTSRKVRKLKFLDEWEWTTLVAAWRYFEHRMTIASASFPEDIVSRYFTGEYDEGSCKRIAHQFAVTDHGTGGENDWADRKYLMDCDKEPWCLFFAFCKAYINGFKTIVLDGESDCKHIQGDKAFFGGRAGGGSRVRHRHLAAGIRADPERRKRVDACARRPARLQQCVI